MSWLQRRRVSRLFSKYVSPEVAKELTADEDAGVPGGPSWRPVIVVVTRIRGFESILEEHSEPAIGAVMREYYAEFEGRLEVAMGPWGRVLFGALGKSAPSAQDALALAAGLMRRQPPGLAEKLRSGWGLDLSVGIAAGRCRVGVVGSETRRSYACLGPASERAQALCDAAGPGEVLLDEKMLMAASRECPEFVAGIAAAGEVAGGRAYRLAG